MAEVHGRRRLLSALMLTLLVPLTRRATIGDRTVWLLCPEFPADFCQGNPVTHCLHSARTLRRHCSTSEVTTLWHYINQLLLLLLLL